MKAIKFLSVMMMVVLLTACSSVSDDKVFDDAVQILTENMDLGYQEKMELSSKSMTEIVEVKDNLYEISGTAFFTQGFDEYSKTYVLKVMYVDGEVTDWEYRLK